MIVCHSMNAASVVGIPEVVGALIPYLMQKNLFELFALMGGRDVKTMSARTITRARAIW